MTVIDSETKLDVPGTTRPMTYEEYLASPEEMARYDILDGWKVYRLYGDNLLPGPTKEHQTVVLNLGEIFRATQRRLRNGKVFIAPIDVLITKRPLRSRQPDVLFISSERLTENDATGQTIPFDPAPELIVEILSPSDIPSVIAAKIADYRSVGVREVWLVRPNLRTVELISLSWEEIKTVATYTAGQTVESRAFRGLTAAVDDIFCGIKENRES